MQVFRLIWGVIWSGLSGGGIGGIVKTVSEFVGKLSDNETTRVTTAIGADKEVAVVRMQTDASAFHDRVDLLKAMKITQWLVAAALIPPLLHQGMIYLDSTPFPRIGTVDSWPWIAMHEIGAWQVAKAPPPFDDREWAMIASLLGIQTVVTAGIGFLRVLTRR